MHDPDEQLMKAVLIQAFKDYAHDTGQEGLRFEVRMWVSDGWTFTLCAVACNTSVVELREKVIKKLDRIDQGEPLKLHKTYE